MKYTNITSIWFGSLTYAGSLVLNIFPGSETFVNFCRWCNLQADLAQDEESLISADYYNGSENDIINILREIEHLSDKGHGYHGYHGEYLLKRLNFLAKEGLNFTKAIYLPEYRKLNEEEVNSIIFSAKKIKKIKRDKKGRFASKRK